MIQFWTINNSLFSAVLQASVVAEEKVERLKELIEPWFMFSLIWSLGGTCNSDSRVVFSDWLREKMKEEEVGLRLIYGTNSLTTLRAT